MAGHLGHVAAGTEIGKGLKALGEIESKGWNQPRKAGFRAERYHEATFNADAARKRIPTRAVATTPGAPADIALVDGGKVVAEVQVKNYKRVAGTTKAISQKKYDGMQKVIPKEQVKGVRSLAARRGTDGSGEHNYQDTSLKAAGRIEANGAKSGALTYEQAQNKNLSRTMMTSEMGNAAKSGAKNGAIIGGAVSAATNLRAVINKEKEVKDALKDVGKDTAVAAVGGAATAALSSGLAAVTTRASLSALSKSGAPGAIAAASVEVGKDLIALRQGKLSGSQVLERSVEHAGAAGGGWGGAAAGMALGTAVFPGVGTVVGGFIGGMAGSTAGKMAVSQVKGVLKKEKAKSEPASDRLLVLRLTGSDK